MRKNPLVHTFVSITEAENTYCLVKHSADQSSLLYFLQQQKTNDRKVKGGFWKGNNNRTWIFNPKKITWYFVIEESQNTENLDAVSCFTHTNDQKYSTLKNPHARMCPPPGTRPSLFLLFHSLLFLSIFLICFFKNSSWKLTSASA